MSTAIKAIETTYKGYRFRSRLEARWAVFFDELGIKWEYEPEGFELPDGTRYLPDFRTTSPTGLVNWYDVKPEGVTSDPKIDKFKGLLDVHILDGDPVEHLAPDAVKDGIHVCPRCGAIGDHHIGSLLSGGVECWAFYCFACDQDTPSTGPEEKGLLAPVTPWKGVLEIELRHVVEYLRRVHAAAIAARSARFEFGESGVRK